MPRRDSIFLGFPTVFFFLRLPQPLAQTINTNKNTNKHKPTPIKNPPNQTIKPTKPPIRNPRRQFETHRSKIIQKKSSLEPPQPQPNHDPTTTNDQQPTSAADPQPTTHFIPARRSTTNDPLQPPIHDQRPASSQLVDPRPTTHFILACQSTTTT